MKQNVYSFCESMMKHSFSVCLHIEVVYVIFSKLCEPCVIVLTRGLCYGLISRLLKNTRGLRD